MKNKKQDLFKSSDSVYSFVPKGNRRFKFLKNNYFRSLAVIVISVFIIFATVKAGTITAPAGTPVANFYTLSEIYEFITNNTAATAGGHSFTFSGSLVGSGKTLTEVYTALAGLISADKVKLGTEYLNIDGTLTPDGGTATTADLFSGATAHLTNDWNLDIGTLNIACNTAVFNGTSNLAADAYDGGGNGTNRWCVTNSQTATSSLVMLGYTSWQNGVLVTGTMPIQTLSVDSVNVNAGYYATTTLSAIDIDLVSGNILSGKTLFGINGNTNVVNTSYVSGNATSSLILTGYSSWLNGILTAGTMPIQTLSVDSVNVNAGYYATTTLSAIDIDLVSGNIKSGATIFGVDGTVSAGYTYGDTIQSTVLTTATSAGTYNATNLFASTTKSGISFGVGLTGEYPSATYTLASADATADLAASGGNISSSNGAVEWWQSDGTRQTATLDFPTLSNVCSGDTSNNSAGTLSVTAAYLSVGNTWCGTAGTLLANLFNGSLTAGGFSGGSQTNGGVDDYNAGNAAGRPTDSYSKGWTSCTSGADNYCGTNDPFADMKDNSTGLVWSKPCSGSGCSTSAEPADTDYSWDGTTDASNNSLTASVLCSQDLGTTHDAGWSLPHQKQLMQAYIDGSYGNLEASGVTRYYWSATTISDLTTSAWSTYLSYGYTYANAKTLSFYVRCVRSAI